MSSYVSRVHQLDAVIWNDELYSLLRAHLRTAMQYLSPGFLSAVEPKLQVLFKCIFFQLPLELYRGTLGHRLLEMEYWESDSSKPASKNKLRLLTLLGVCVPSLWKIFAQLVVKLTKNSTYPSILDRLLGVKPVYTSPQKIREVSYEGLNRELLWHGFAELLTFVLPIVNVHRIKGSLKRSFRFLQYKGESQCNIIDNVCTVCGQLPVYPHEIGCCHVFCYYCIASNVLADPQYSCNACNHEASGLASVKPLSIRLDK